MEQQRHKHAEHMLHYAQDAMTTDKPWELWEYRNFGSDWYTCYANPQWSDAREYRRKPEPSKVEQTYPYTITCTMVISAVNSDDAAWQFRELLASGCYPVQWVDKGGATQNKSGVRPRGQ